MTTPDEIRRRAEELRERTEDKGRDEVPPSGFSIAMRLGTEIVAGVAAGTLVGYGLDSWLGTMPLFLLICLLFGTAAGFMNLYRTNARYAQLLEEYENKAKNAEKDSAKK